MPLRRASSRGTEVPEFAWTRARRSAWTGADVLAQSGVFGLA